MTTRRSALADWMMGSRWRVFGALVLTVGLPMAALTFLIFAQVHRSLEAQSLYRNTLAARLAAKTVQERLEGLRTVMQSAAERSSLAAAIERRDVEETREHLKEIMDSDSELDRILVTDTAGNLWLKQPPSDGDGEAVNLASQEWYGGVSVSQEVHVSGIYRSSLSPAPHVVAIAAPVRGSGGRTVAYLVGQHWIGKLAAWFSRIRPSQLDPIFFILVDQYGGMAAAESDEEFVPLRLSGHPLAEEIAGNTEGWGQAPHPLTGEPCLISWTPIGWFGWKVLALQPREAVMAPILALDRVLFILAVVFIVGILLTGFIWLGLIQAHHAEREEAERKLRETHVQLKRSHEQLQATQLSLIHAAKMESVGRLAAGVAHEVKNPLAVVMQGLDYLEGYLPPPVRDDTVTMVLQDGKNAVRRADRVIRGLLDFSITRQLEIRDTAVNSVLDQAIFLVKHELDKGQIRLIKEMDPALPLVRMDRQKMEQVFVNLLMNAIQATPRGGALRVRSYPKRLGEGGDPIQPPPDRFPPGEPAVAVEIEDTGSGVPADLLPRIFDPFVTLKPSGKGTGLGLTVSKNIVDLHGAWIDIRNRKEGGARVTLLFKIGGRSGERA